MEKFEIKEDVRILCLHVPTFPNGIKEAFMELQSKLPDNDARTSYAISYFGGNGKVVYKAALTELQEGEGEKFGYENFTILHGDYIGIAISDWMQQIALIGKTFTELMKDGRTEKNYPCIEWYKSTKELVCMMRLKENSNK